MESAAPAVLWEKVGVGAVGTGNKSLEPAGCRRVRRRL